MEKQITKILFLALVVLLTNPGNIQPQENEENELSLAEIMAPGTITLSMLLSDFEMSWLYTKEEEIEESFKIFRLGVGVGVFPARHILVEGLLRFGSVSLYEFEWSDLGVGISGFPPLGKKGFADVGAEWLWRNWSGSGYEYDYEPINEHEVGGHVGLGFMATRHFSLGAQIYYKRTLANEGYYYEDEDINWFGMRFRFLVFLPPQ